MKNNRIQRINPVGVPEPVGRYSHITKIPRDSEIYVSSGQVGVDLKGNIPSNLNDQVSNTFFNISNLLSSQGLHADDVIKINIWATEQIDWDFFDSKWDELFGDNPPSMTIAYISGLGLPELKIEIEVWAAK
ncbi:endoribonuclease L-PSP [Gottschalkia acidurici 9a]|uniref:Endoribonuclease L-PSP n=1 Tax=Gottschalkia acidurici (strain ATCC 7906 / DSM 604 / BCRC 14475 / CIP 104303 / KCTC 5404 / NCIMB 10678 / 9a) TaxID=1128398 RepID=K0AX78_GOTA9|nr:RidA family protein [Gottschalkia acidurici]AFS77824.1 endoribonuclease L-PSP [Gottschalkia acidurici 9a]